MTSPRLIGFARSAIGLAIAAAVAPALAQNTTASVSGRVVGADGKPVVGATVSVLHVESRTASNLTTDADGRYSARGLRVGGPYTVTVTKGGQSEKRDNVFLTLAETTSLDIAMLGSTASVTVTGRSASDKFQSSTMGAGTNISSRDLAAQASIQRSLQDYARFDPRLAQTDKERGEISAAGQNTRFNSITIDGVTTNDTFGLEANNLPTIKQPISIEAIQSVQVNISNYDVTQKGYTGANINAVTKSGSNDVKGSVYYVTRDDRLVGQRYNATTDTYFDAPKFTDNTKGFTLGGPIVQNKLFFFVNHEAFTSSRTRPDFAPIGGAGTIVGLRQSTIDQAIAIGRDTYKVDLGTSVVPEGVAVNVKDSLLKLDWNISDQHRANVRFTRTEQTEPFLVGFNSTGLSLSSYWYNQEKSLKSVVGQLFSDWTDNISTEFKISKRDYDSVPTPVNGVRLPQISLNFSGALPSDAPAGTSANTRSLLMGTERSRHFNVLRTNTLDTYLGANYRIDKHELKFGLDRADNDVYNAFLQDTNGRYTFQCENSSASLSYSFGSINCATATADQVASAVLENFRLGRPSQYFVQVPQPGRVLNDAVAIWSYANTGVFLQDTFKPSKSLSLVAGLRLDRLAMPKSPLANPAAAAAPVAGNPATNTRAGGGFGLDNTRTLDGATLFQPRVGFNWDLGTADTRRQLRGGFGLFQGAAANVWLSNPYSNTGRAAVTYQCTTYAACVTANARFSANPDAQPVLTGTIPAANVDFLDPSLKQPSVWKFNLAFDTELPNLPLIGRTTAGVEMLGTRVKDGIYYEHLNLGVATRTGLDGRQLFYTPSGYNASCWTATGSTLSGTGCADLRNKALSNPAFNNVLVAKGTDQGGGNAVTLSLSKIIPGGAAWSMGYTRTSATEVSPLTSSVANSNWLNRNIFNPNEQVLQNSNYLIRDRFNAAFSLSRAFISKAPTTVGFFFEGRRGKPYSWTYLNDLNGDGVFGNDLMYIPKAPGSGEVVFRGGAAEETRFWDIVEANPALRNAKGGVVGRNNEYAPWVNSFDVRLSQQLPGFGSKQRATITLDILNFGNLLNKKWGRINEIAFPSNRSFVNYAGLDTQGRYVYSLGSTEALVTRQASGESQWAAQLTMRYEF
jgi:hypothetical protein